MRARAALLAVFAFAAVPLFPQQLPRSGETIEVSIVNVDVVVTDKAGHRVRGLTRDDFEIYADGKRQEISNFAEYGTAAGEAHVSIDAAGKPQSNAVRDAKRTVAVFVDAVWLQPDDAKRFFGTLSSLLHRIIRAGDTATIVQWMPAQRTIMTTVAPTDDLRVLDAALTALASRRLPQPDTTQLTESERQWLQSIDRDIRTTGGKSTLNVAESSSMPALTQMYVQMRAKSEAITALTESMSGAEGRKALIFASQSFGWLGTGSLYNSLLAGPVTAPATVRASSPVAPDVPSGARFISNVIRTANANGVTLYPIYAPGLRVAMPLQTVQSRPRGDDDSVRMATEAFTNEIGALDHIAKETGGIAAANVDEAVRMWDDVVADFDSYYSLAYRVPPRGRDYRQAISVRVKNPNYAVRSRRNFVEKSDDTRMKDRVVSNLFGPPIESVIPIDVTLGDAKPTAKNRWSIPVKISIPVAALSTSDAAGGAHAGKFSVYFGWGSALGAVGDTIHKTQQFTIPAEKYEETRDSRFTYDMELLVDVVASKVSVAVVDDATGDAGYRVVDLPRHLPN